MKRAMASWGVMAVGMLAMGILAGGANAQCNDNTVWSGLNSSPFGAFGHAGAASGNTLMVGEPGSRLSSTGPRGSVYFYERDGMRNMIYNYGYFPHGLPDGARFGSSVSISGDYAVVGAPGYSIPDYPNLGVVAVFHRVDGFWRFETYVFNPINAPDQSFGADVAIHGNAMVVGATAYNSLQGIAYFFEREGTSWVLRSALTPTEGRSPQGIFGASVAIGDNWIAVGSPRYNSPNGQTSVGSVHFYRRNGSVAQWSGFLAGVASDDLLGSDVAVTPTQIFAGWPGQRGVVSWSTAGNVLSQQMTIGAPADTATRNYRQMGMSLAVSPDGTHLVMNSPSSTPRMALQYELQPGRATYQGAHLPMSSDGGDMGPGLALFDDQIALGSEFATVSNRPVTGAVYMRQYLLGAIESPCAPMVLTGPGTWHNCTAGGPVVATPEDCANSQESPSNWFLFDPPCPGPFLVSTGESAFPIALSAYMGTCEDRVLRDCESMTPGWGLGAAMQIDTTDGPVLLRVAGAGGSAGWYALTIAPMSQVNDTCFGAQALEPGTYPVCNQYASQDFLADVYCSPRQMPSNDVWYTFTPTCSGTATIAAHNNTFDTVLAAYTGGCFAGYQLLACNDDSFPYGTGSMLQFPATAGTTYTLRLGGYYADIRGNADLTVEFVRGCAADFNVDGGVDGSDVGEFFSKWEAGEPCADVNEDGGVDGSDVSWFFGVWEAGDC